VPTTFSNLGIAFPLQTEGMARAPSAVWLSEETVQGPNKRRPTS